MAWKIEGVPATRCKPHDPFALHVAELFCWLAGIVTLCLLITVTRARVTVIIGKPLKIPASRRLQARSSMARSWAEAHRVRSR